MRAMSANKAQKFSTMKSSSIKRREDATNRNHFSTLSNFHSQPAHNSSFIFTPKTSTISFEREDTASNLNHISVIENTTEETRKNLDNTFYSDISAYRGLNPQTNWNTGRGGFQTTDQGRKWKTSSGFYKTSGKHVGRRESSRPRALKDSAYQSNN